MGETKLRHRISTMKKIILSPFFLLILSVSPAFPQKENEKPAVAPAAVRYGLVVDNSGSYRTLLERVIGIVKEIVESNQPEDEAFLVTFVNTDKIRLQQDMTKSKELLSDAAEEMYIEGGLTAILDAVSFSAKHLVEKTNSAPDRARVLILVTDGDERKSVAKVEEVIKYLRDEKIRVFALGLSDEKVSMKILDKLTKESGGKKYLPKTRMETSGVIKELSADIRR